MSEINLNSAAQISAAVKSGEVSAVKVTEASLAQIEAKDTEINSFNTVSGEIALAQAEAVDQKVASGEELGPFAGVPIGVKDLFCTEGIKTTCSSKILENWVPPYNATCVEDFLAADAVIVGKTNCDEFGMGGSNENSAFGPVKNPLDTTRVPGGSSGGSAACVAAGMVPISLGTDTGGSVRQPASLCGLVGFKPTYGAVSRYGMVAFASSFDTVAAFSTNVADSAASFDLLAHADGRDATCIPGDRETVSDVVENYDGLDGLRVGVIKELAGDGIEGFEPEVIEQLNNSVNALADSGAKVDEVSLPGLEAAISAYYILNPAEASSNLARFDGVRFGLREPGGNTAEMIRASRTAGFGEEVKRRIMVGTYALSSGYYDAYYAKAQKLRALLIKEFTDAYKDFDVLLSPTSPVVAFPIGGIVDPMSLYLLDIATCPVNMAGLPAISVPFGTGAHGLPVGIQAIAPAMGEARMYKVAKALEEKQNG